MRFADRRKAVIVATGSVVATGALVALVFSLGSWAYQHRRFLSHEQRLARALQEHPTVADISNALQAEPGVRAIDVPRSDEELAALARPRSDEVLARRRASRELRIFAVGDMVYFLFFDAEGRLQSYVLIGN